MIYIYIYICIYSIYIYIYIYSTPEVNKQRGGASSASRPGGLSSRWRPGRPCPGADVPVRADRGHLHQAGRGPRRPRKEAALRGAPGSRARFYRRVYCVPKGLFRSEGFLFEVIYFEGSVFSFFQRGEREGRQSGLQREVGCSAVRELAGPGWQGVCQRGDHCRQPGSGRLGAAGQANQAIAKGKPTSDLADGRSCRHAGAPALGPQGSRGRGFGQSSSRAAVWLRRVSMAFRFPRGLPISLVKTSHSQGKCSQDC